MENGDRVFDFASRFSGAFGGEYICLGANKLAIIQKREGVKK